MKRSSDVKIGRLQVKKIKQFGNHATQLNNSHIILGGHQETTNTEGISSQEGEPSSTGMKLREKKKIEYTESSTETNSSGSEYQEKPKKIKTNKEMKIKSSSSPAGSSSSSIQPGSQRQTPDLLTDSDEVERVQMSEEDFNKFTKVFQKLENKKKWVLTSGKVVEDELYKFGMRCNYEQSFVEENIFSPSELKEIYTYNQKSLPNMPQDLLEYLGSYQLAPRVFRPEPWQSAYNRQKDFDRDWIRNTVDNLIREYETDSLKKGDHLEGWLLSHVWLFIDKAFENIEGVEAIRGESCSIASSSRKNRDRKVPSVSSMPRKIMGRKGDLIIRCMYREYGCGEAGKLHTGYNGTKILRERGLKTPKMMKDQFDDLCIHMGSKEKKVRKLETIGFIHAGLSVLLLRLDSPAGYVSRISRSKMLTIPSNI
ncbi:18317_t:CDS:2, partial [Funneliformis geosporum]